MRIGGIEDHFSRMVKSTLDSGRRVIWLTTKSHEIASDYRVMGDARVEKAYITRTIFGPVYPKIDANRTDDVFMITTDPCRYAISDTAYRNMQCHSFNHILLLPHYTGPAYYPERAFRSGFMRDFWFRKMQQVAEVLVERDAIRACSEKQIAAYEDGYGVQVKEPKKKLLPRTWAIPDVDKEEILSRERARADRFEIVTCARFDFPHKGYLLGLIREFETLHAKFPQVWLTIVGYGAGEERVHEAIAALPEGARACVEVIGPLAPEELMSRYRGCQLNVGVAGALVQGALCGVPSLNMAHYTEECEGFGFLEDAGDVFPEDTPRRMADAIESVITMSPSEYVTRSQGARRFAVSLVDDDPDYVFRQSIAAEPRVPLGAAAARVLFGLRAFCQKALRRGMFEQ